MLTENCIKQS